jgi:hypothetical protein
LAIAKQIDEHAKIVQIDLVGGFLRARVTIDVDKPPRRWILIDSPTRKSRDWYGTEYEHIPHFCFSCGRLGHSDQFCPMSGTRDENGDLSFKPSSRAQDDWRKANSGDSSSKEKQESQNSRRESWESAAKKDNNTEVNSPVKNRNHQNK